jgi:hypothetical protein
MSASKPDLVEFEWQTLEECAGITGSIRPWGAAVSAALETLRGRGLIEVKGGITPKGIQALIDRAAGNVPPDSWGVLTTSPTAEGARALVEIALERRRQVEGGDLVGGGEGPAEGWSPRRFLVKGAALILAELEDLDRAGIRS